MKSSIFNFIGDFSSTLEELALRVEALLWDQPQAAITQSRLFGEMLVSMIFEQENMNEVYPMKQVEKINRLYKHDIIQDDIYKKLEYIRKNGNIASHQVLEMCQEVAKQVHQALFDISVWYAEVYGHYTFSAPTYELPSKPNQDHHDMKQWMDAYIQETTKRLTEIEAHLEQLKQEKYQQEDLVNEKEKSRVRTALKPVKSNERSFPLEQFESTFKKVNFKRTNLIAIHPSIVEQEKMFMEVPNKQRKSTALRRFPKMEEGGKLKSNYGYMYTFQTKRELEELLRRVVEILNSRNPLSV
ncbi:DUF4145 domain-containing protein [Alkalihalobacterium sp. APHAB7]|uniref:DUF4145 domain-containing protein n=1 Tax=Alkalihalobacterium sp. APHAB7 TaxID=3402081 RepID=UPI003AAEC1B1